MISSTVSLKHLNIDRVRTVMKQEKEATKISIANSTGLSVATCGNILKELLETGEVFELDLAESTGGRPSRRFTYNKNFAYIGCLYMSRLPNSFSVTYAVVNLTNEVVKEATIESNKLNLTILDKIVHQLILDYPDITVLSFGIPGVVRDGLIDDCDIKDFIQIDMKTFFEDKYSIDCLIDNDVNATTLGYYDRTGNSEEESLAFVFYPLHNRPGSGFVIDGHILRGHTNFAGEVGYLPFDINMNTLEDNSMTDEAFIILVAKTLTTINCIINPKRIILSGDRFDTAIIEAIKLSLDSMTPHTHVPTIIYENSIHNSYIGGLTSMAMEVL